MSAIEIILKIAFLVLFLILTLIPGQFFDWIIRRRIGWPGKWQLKPRQPVIESKNQYVWMFRIVGVLGLFTTVISLVSF